MSNVAIETRSLRKCFGQTTALAGLDLSVPSGSVYGLLGKNAAGKTTAIRLLAGLLRPDSGTCSVLGVDLATASRDQRAKVAYVPQQDRLHPKMTVGEHASYLAMLYPGFEMAFSRDLTRRFELEWSTKIGAMSGGQKRKAATLLALASRPEVLLLDEPAAGLDPAARRELIDVLIELMNDREDCTVLLSTHIVSDLERLAEHIGIVHHGVLLHSGALDTLIETIVRVQVIFGDNGPPPGFSIPGSLRTSREGVVVSAVAKLSDPTALDEVRAIPDVRVDTFRLGLEDVFIELVDETRIER